MSIVVQAPQILAAVPIDASAFKQIPPWSIVFVACTILAILVGAHGHKVVPEKIRSGHILVDVLELLLIASAVAAAATTPLIGSIEKAITTGITNIHNHFASFSFAAIAIVVVILVGLWYRDKGFWWIGILFGLSFLVLSGTIPDVATFLTWFINHPAAWMWNFILSGFNWVFNRSFT